MKRLFKTLLCLSLCLALLTSPSYAGLAGDVVTGFDQSRDGGSAAMGGVADGTTDLTVDYLTNITNPSVTKPPAVSVPTPTPSIPSGGTNVPANMGSSPNLPAVYNGPSGGSSPNLPAVYGSVKPGTSSNLPAVYNGPRGSSPNLPAVYNGNAAPSAAPASRAGNIGTSGANTSTPTSALNSGLKVGGAGLSVYGAAANTIDLFTNPSEHETEEGKVIDNSLRTVNTGLSIYMAGAAVLVAVGSTVTLPVSGTLIVISAAVATAANTFHGKTGRDMMDLAKGRARLGFAPLEKNKGAMEGVEVIKDELGFDLYPGRGHSRRVNVEKPNIYLYSDEDMTVGVRLGNSEFITKSIPEYAGGWSADIYGGSLNGSEDYLFYEASLERSLFQVDRGYVLRASDLEADLSAVLDATGYSEKEKADFLEYWLGRFEEGTSYLMCPQSLEVIEDAMKLELSVPADSVNRYWYYFVPLPLKYEEAEIVPIVRDGFTVVEWGGMLD